VYPVLFCFSGLTCCCQRSSAVACGRIAEARPLTFRKETETDTDTTTDPSKPDNDNATHTSTETTETFTETCRQIDTLTDSGGGEC
jgi:hypothetical protein